MAKKLKLSSSLSGDYTIFGIACHLKDYRMTFLINQKLGISFRREEDLSLGDADNKKSYSFYIFKHPDERRNYFLISNHHPDGRLIPVERGIDFFIVVDDVLPSTLKKQLVSCIQSIPNVLTAFEIDPGKIKDLDIIFEEIELHLLKK